MSARAEVQAALVAALVADGRWTAPYGVLEGLEALPRGGKVRTVTFGVARTLDAQARIWSPARITIRGEGPFASRVEGEFGSLEEVVEHLERAWG